MKKRNLIHQLGLKSIPVLLVYSILFVSNASAIASEEKRDLSPFNKIEISGSYNVVLVQGTEESIRIEADENVISKIITKVEKGTLEISNDKNRSLNDEVKITIHFKSIEEITSSGAIKLSSLSVLKMPKLEIEMSGSSNSNLEINAQSLEVEISGSGKVNLKGSSKSVEVEISGSGSFDAEDLIAENYEIAISGVGKATVNVSTKLEVEISGTGTVSYKGDPNIKQEISGTGILKKI